MELIKLPPDISIAPSHNQVESIVDAVYPSLLQKYNDLTYLKKRAILTPKNEMVHDLNEKIMNIIPGEGRTYYSSDNMCKASVTLMRKIYCTPLNSLIPYDSQATLTMIYT